MARYEKYKPTNIEWLPELPDQWKISKAKYYFKYTTGFTPPTGQEEFYNEGIIWITIADMNKKIIDESSTTLSKLAIEKYKPDLSIKGSLLYSFKLSVGKVAFAGKDLYTNEAIISILPNEKYDIRYFYYSLPEQLLKNANENIYGAKMLNQELIRNAIITFPPKATQTAIGNYLDKKTAQIDKLIGNKQQLIELLKEERTAIINEAVSGEGKGWEWKKLKYVAKLKSGETITGDDIKPDGEYLVFGGNGIRGYTSKFTHKGNYVLIGRQGALCGNINYASGEFFASEHAIVSSIINDDNYIWLGELLRNMNLNQYSLASAQPGLSVERIQNLSVLVPPIIDQNEIVAHIQTSSGRIDSTINIIDQEIQLLQEYKTALISEAVTGKIKVA